MRCAGIRYLATYNTGDFAGMTGIEFLEPGDITKVG